MMKYEELDKIGIDGDEIEYPLRESTKIDKMEGDEYMDLKEKEKQKFIDDIRDDLRFALELDDEQFSSYIRQINDKTNFYLHHESNGFMELVERN